jgi:hypothetical protein
VTEREIVVPTSTLRLTREVRLSTRSEVMVETRSSGHRSVDSLQVLEVGELDHDAALLRRHLNTHARVEVFRKEMLEFQESRWSQSCRRGEPGTIDRVGRTISSIRWRATSRVRSVRGVRPNGVFDHSNRPSAGSRFSGELLLTHSVGGSEQCPSMARTELTIGEQPLDRWR